ncbi:MAG: ATP-binding protein [Christensenellales bacterium]
MKDNAKKSKKHIRNLYVFSLSMVVFVVITIVLITWYILLATEAITVEYLLSYGGVFMFLFIIASVLLGMGLAVLISILIFRPMNVLINGITKLSEGDYSVRIELKGFEAMRNLATGFNNLAAELENTEILRSDFVNNFSHEFKTPIMSISGLVGMLQKGNVPKEKQTEYISIIADETERLTSMATNVLNLSKVENQVILTSKAKYNLSEQIRDCLVLLEKKWAQKNLELCVDFDEVEITACEDMMKQVWYNLLDNAVKFAREGGRLSVSIERGNTDVRVTVSDEGAVIAPENIGKVFNRFYREDSSHSQEGSGIGLSIVKRITELHGGCVRVASADGETSFTVILPQ